MTGDLVASNLKLGQEITFSHRLERKVEEYRSGGVRLRMSDWKVWRRTPYIDSYFVTAGVEPEYRPGIVVGKRTLQNGVRQWFEDEGFNFIPKERFEAYLIAYDLRRAPVHVLPEDIMLSAEETL